MKICITARGETLESAVDPRFGRCAYFIIVDPETMEFECIANAAAKSGGGAGIQAGQMMSEKGVKAVLTGNVGPNAFKTLQTAGIDIITGIGGTVADATARYIKGEVTPSSAATVESHFGAKG
ncbi:MAG: NifB/NifX family molybdenum-iron cluster-binding protein [Spirochaetia bacterium]|jgi:predicted Fe-Mo cluster-binding NifX family protein